MRVVVNLLSASGRKTGVGYYASQLVNGLRKQAPNDEIAEFPSIWIRELRGPCDWFFRRIQRKQRASALNKGAAPANSGGRAKLVACARALMGWRFHGRYTPRNCDLYHEPNFIPLPSDLPTVTTIHDLSVLLHPEWHPMERVKFYERHFRAGLDRSVHFLTDSEFTRQEVIQTLQIASERVTRTYMGVRDGLGPLDEGETAATLRELGLPPRYLLYLGTLEPRKNVLMLLRAYCSLPDSVRETWPLILVGGWGWKTEAIAEFLHTEARHKNVRRLGYVPDEHSAAIYNGARALLYPSLYEGFGLPPIEMLACGGAVLASSAGPMAETVGGQAHLTSPDDLDGWRSAMLRVVQDDDWWRALRRGAEEKASMFTWDRCAAETLKVYRKVCGIRQPLIKDANWTHRAAG